MSKIVVLFLTSVLSSASVFADCAGDRPIPESCVNAIRDSQIEGQDFLDESSVKVSSGALVRRGNQPEYLECFYTYKKHVELEGFSADVEIVGYYHLSPKTCAVVGGEYRSVNPARP